MARVAHLAFGLFACASVGCFNDGTGDATGTDGTADGKTLYEQPISDGNSFACATCHALKEPAIDGYRRPGHPIGDATKRPTYKNGQHKDMRLAVNSCLKEWMNAEPWSADDERWKALHGYLDEQAPGGSAPALAYEIVNPPAELSGGDAATGNAVFNGTCAVCHGANAVGTSWAPPLAGGNPTYWAGRVRLSGRTDSPTYPGLIGGVMPFWAKDRLSDEELIDIVAWLETIEPPTGTGTGTGGTTTGTTTGGTTTGGSCDSTHPKVGWVATLETYFHNVGGDVEIIDDCTVVIRNFTYDGTGIDVRIYGGVGGDYDGGYAMTDDLIKAGGYNGTTLWATLPDGMTLDDLDGISVWCVDVGADFGSGLFAAP